MSHKVSPQTLGKDSTFRHWLYHHYAVIPGIERFRSDEQMLKIIQWVLLPSTLRPGNGSDTEMLSERLRLPIFI